MTVLHPPGARPTNNISIEFEIRSKFGVLYFKIYLIDHNEILHTSLQYNCRDVSKISMWSMLYFKPEHCKFWSNFEFDRNVVSGRGARLRLCNSLWEEQLLFDMSQHLMGSPFSIIFMTYFIACVLNEPISITIMSHNGVSNQLLFGCLFNNVLRLVIYNKTQKLYSNDPL